VDMQSLQTGAQQAEKSKGAGRPRHEGGGLTRASSSQDGTPVISGSRRTHRLRLRITGFSSPRRSRMGKIFRSLHLAG
jgi:hypothetical protein